MKRVFLLFLVMGGGWLSCSALQERLAVRNLQITFTSATLKTLSLSGASLELVFSAKNPNPVRAVLDRFSFSLYGNDRKLATGETSQKLAVDPGETATLTLEVFVPWQGLPAAVIQALKERSARLKVEGFAHVSTPLGDVRFRVVDVARTFR